MEVKARYKMSEIGMIPSDWHTVQLMDVATVVSGGTPDRNCPEYWGGYIPWITTALVDYSLITDASEHITAKGLANSSARIVTAGSILMAMYGQGKTRAKVAILGIDAAINQACAAILPFSKSVEASYLYAYLASQYERLRGISNSGGQENLSAQIIKHLQIPLPTLPEQRAIAEALADVDAQIGTLETMIVKKQALKQGTMQALLSGQRRLMGFTSKWRLAYLGQLGSFSKGQGVTKSDANSGEIPCIRYGELYTRHDSVIRKYYSFVSTAVASTSRRLSKGDILFAASGETKEEIGKCAAFLGDEAVYAGGDIIILSPKGCDSCFLGYYLNFGKAAKWKATKGQGDAVVHIHAKTLATLPVEIPQHDEQTAIASILTDIDKEIEALKDRLRKVQQIKAAMMQELLTGRIRLV